MTVADLVQQYVTLFNERRCEEAAALFALESRFVWISFADPQRGPDGYRQFVRRWTAAFPDTHWRLTRLDARGEGMCSVDLLAAGTHDGLLDMGNYQFKPTGAHVSIRLQHLFESENDRIVYASVSVDAQEIVRQLTRLDLAALDAHLDQIVRLRAELTDAPPDDGRLRELTERLGRELDAARHVLRPYFRH